MNDLHWCFDKVDETSETSGVFEENPRPISSAGGDEQPKKHSDLDPGKGSIGEFCDKDVPLIYCCRKLVDQFLLSPLKGKIFFSYTLITFRGHPWTTSPQSRFTT